MREPWQLGAVEAARAIEAGDLTPEALMRACLERIAEREPEVQAWIHLEPERALAAAGAARPGPLHGLPVGVKDIFDTADMPTAYGSPIYAGNRPVWDAASVALARAAGAVMAGKTVTTEFAFLHPGKTRNPHDPRRTPGGSSSGSAAAVAAGMVPLAYGTQTAGSVIRPAAYCGVVGFKPSYGLIPTAGVKQLAWSLDTIGLFARSVADAALFAGVLTGRDLIGALQLETPPVVGVCRTPQWHEAEPAVDDALETASLALGAAGATLRDVEMPERCDGLLEAQVAIMSWEAARCLAHERAAHPDKLSPELRALLDDGTEVDAATRDAGHAQTRSCRHWLSQCLGEVDVLLVPSAPGPAPLGLTATGNPVFNRIWTLLGVPCVNLPGMSDAEGLPVGLQVIGPPRGDARTLAVAGWMADRLG